MNGCVAGDSIVLVNTLWGSDAAIVAVNLASGDVLRLSPPSGGFSVLLNTPACIYAASSSLASLPSISARTLDPSLAAADQWKVLEEEASKATGMLHGKQ